MPILRAHTGFRLALLAVCAAGTAAGLAACESRPVIVDGMLEWEDDGTPSNAGEATRHLIGSNNPDWRRKAVGYLADQDYGGEPQYLAPYRGQLLSKGVFVDAEQRAGLKLGIKDPDAGVRAAAARALGDHGGAEDGAALVPLLADKEPMVRLAAADALRKIELSGEAQGGAQEGLVKLLADDDVDVRAKAADALGHFPSERTVRALMDALEDSSFTVVSCVRRSLAACAGVDGEGNPVDFGFDSRLWGQWLAGHKGAFAATYRYEPWYRRPSVVQWGDVSPWWRPYGWAYSPPEGVLPRAKPLREASSLDRRKEIQAAQEKRERDFKY